MDKAYWGNHYKNNDAETGTSRVRWKSCLESKERREGAGEGVEDLRIILRNEFGNGPVWLKDLSCRLDKSFLLCGFPLLFFLLFTCGSILN